MNLQDKKLFYDLKRK